MALRAKKIKELLELAAELVWLRARAEGGLGGDERRRHKRGIRRVDGPAGEQRLGARVGAGVRGAGDEVRREAPVERGERRARDRGGGESWLTSLWIIPTAAVS